MKRALFVVLLLAGSAYAKPPDVGPVAPLKFTPAEPTRLVLSNGAVAYLLEDHELPLISISVKMRTSPADEDESQAGLLGMAGDVWRSGGTALHKPHQLDEELERMASEIETKMNYEEAVISLNTLTQNRSRSLALFVDVLLRPGFDAEQVSIAKSKMNEALRRKNDDPANVGRRAFRDVIFGEHHIYAREVNERSVKKIGRADLLRAHKRIIVPDEAIIIAVGDFKTDELVKELEAALAPWKKTGRSVGRYDYALRNPPEGAIFFVQKDINQSRVTAGRLGVARHHPDHFKLMIADYILGGGGASRLFGQIRSRLGLAYAVGSFVLEPRGPGIIGLGAQTKAASTAQIITAINEELKKFSEAPPTDEELKLAKDSISNSFIFNFNSPAAIAAQKADLEFHGYPADYLETFLANVAAVSGADVLNTAKAYYTPEKMKILVVGDKNKLGTPLNQLGNVVEIPLESIR